MGGQEHVQVKGCTIRLVRDCEAESIIRFLWGWEAGNMFMVKDEQLDL